MAAYEIPLSAKPENFSITLNDVSYNMRSRWSNPQSCWVIDMASSENVPILQGIPLIPGVDLLEQFAYLGIGGAMYAQVDHDADAVPSFENLGTLGHLYFVTL